MLREHRVAICGAAGFAGRCIVETLALDPRWEITALDHTGAGLEGLAPLTDRVLAIDFDNPQEVGRALQGARYVVSAFDKRDYALGRDELRRRNFRWSMHVAHAALESRAQRLLHLSSAGVYGRPKSVPVTEADPIHPANPYEESKALAEKALWELHHASGLPLVVLRPAMMYGPGARFGPALLFALYSVVKYYGERKVVVPYGGARMHHVSSEDMGRAAAFLLGAPDALVEGKAFNLADETPLSWGTFMQTTIELLGLRASARHMISTRRQGRMSFLSFFERVPAGMMNAFNRRLALRWRTMVERGVLSDALPPRLDRELFGYLRSDHIYDTTALKSLGFTLSRPKTIPGMQETFRWYRDQRWIYN